MTHEPYEQEVESKERFLEKRLRDIESMGSDHQLRHQALQLQARATQYRFGYQQLWCGVPVIRLPDDIVLVQEIIHSIRPECIVETGIARGGGLLLNASLMEIAGLVPKVLGIDILIYTHAREAISQSKYAMGIELVESDSISTFAELAVQRFISQADDKNPVLLVLDSNHTHAHVLAELKLMAQHLPIGSIVVVADTIVAEMPESFYSDRPWGTGNNPYTAVAEFLSGNASFTLDNRWAKRGLLSELRDGILLKVN